jgi:hypothetical protein
VSTEEPMSIEDRIRTATQAGATIVRDIGPMTAREPARLRRRPAPAARRWGTWGIPLAAAAAVVLVAVSLVAVRHFGASAPATGPATTGSATTVPRYYAALDEVQTGWTGAPLDTGYPAGALIVGDDLTGKSIATVNPPDGVHFDSVQGASDDRTFVVMADRQATPASAPDTWYLLRIAPGTAHSYQLIKLPIKLPGSSSNGIDFALSPDQRELAIESLGGESSTGDTGTIALYSVSSGAELRAWTARKYTPGRAAGSLSWLSSGRQLAFTDIPPGPGQLLQLRTLDVTGSGTDLITASRVELTLKSTDASPSSCWSMHLAPDGGTVVCGTQYSLVDGGPGTNAGCANGGLVFTAYSVRTGKPVRVVYRYPGPCHNGINWVLWMNASGTEMIGATEIDVANQGGKQVNQIGVIADGHIHPLRVPKSVPQFYGTFAF